MNAFVNEKSPETLKYKRYLFSELSKPKIFPDEGFIRIRVANQETPFPDIKLILDNPLDINDREDENPHPDYRRLNVLSELLTYTKELLSPFCTIVESRPEGSTSVNVIFFLSDIKYRELYIQLKKLGLRVPNITNKQKGKIEPKSKFNVRPPQIIIGGRSVPIPPNTLQFCLCRVAFSKPVGEIVHWDEVASDIDGLPKNNLKTGWRSVYDAILEVNKKSKSISKKRLFKTAKKSFIRLF